jgi:hypothetical protein
VELRWPWLGNGESMVEQGRGHTGLEGWSRGGAAVKVGQGGRGAALG